MILRYLNFLEKILYLENKINCGVFFRSSIVLFMWFFFLFCFNYVCLFALNDGFLLYTKVPHTALKKSWTGREGLIDCFSIPAGDTSSYLPVNNGPLKTKAEIPSFNSRDPRSYLTPAHQVPSSAGLRRK